MESIELRIGKNKLVVSYDSVNINITKPISADVAKRILLRLLDLEKIPTNYLSVESTESPMVWKLNKGYKCPCCDNDIITN